MYAFIYIYIYIYIYIKRRRSRWDEWAAGRFSWGATCSLKDFNPSTSIRACIYNFTNLFDTITNYSFKQNPWISTNTLEFPTFWQDMFKQTRAFLKAQSVKL